MGKKQKAVMTVVIKGEKCSGRTTLLAAIGSGLKAQGFNVVCKDEYGEAIPKPAIVDRKLDDRLIRVVIKEV